MRKKGAGGRPTKYDPKFCEQGAKLCKLGATDEQLADFFGVAVSTLNLWKHEHPEFSESLKGAKDEANERVKRALFERAIGYTHEAVKIFNHEGEPLVVPYTEHYPPDTAAAFIWLKNREPENWKDKQQHELTGKDGAPITPIINLSLKTK